MKFLNLWFYFWSFKILNHWRFWTFGFIFGLLKFPASEVSELLLKKKLCFQNFSFLVPFSLSKHLCCQQHKFALIATQSFNSSAPGKDLCSYKHNVVLNYFVLRRKRYDARIGTTGRERGAGFEPKAPRVVSERSTHWAIRSRIQKD